MALQNEPIRPFRLYVTHVDGEGPFLRISGQLDKQSACMIESLIDSSRENLEKGIGAVPPAAIIQGIVCAAKYKDGTYYRAKIISTTNLANGLVGVHFIDYGNKDIISLSTIRFLDKYDPLLQQLRGQASEYILSSIMHPSGSWEEPTILKLQSLLCYSEYPAIIKAQTHGLPIISVQFQGNDLTDYLIANRYGVPVPQAKQEVLAQLAGNSVPTMPTWMNEQQNYTEPSNAQEHMPFLPNQNFPSNPASAMRLQQFVNYPVHGGFSVPPPSAISQRLMVNKAVPTGTPVTLKPPTRQPFQSNQVTTPPPAAASPGPIQAKTSPKKVTKTYRSKLLEINSQHKVFVSYAEEGPELFGVQLVSDAARLQDMMDDINRQPHRSLTEPPMIGTVCLGRMSGDRIICRAIVMNLSGTQCKLFFVDFGDTEMVSYYDIFDIPEEFVKPNVFAMRFCLSGVKKLPKGPHVNESFKELVDSKVLTLKVVPPEGPPLIQYGELFIDNQNVLDILMNNLKNTMQFKSLEMLTRGSKVSVLVSYVDTCLKFYIQQSDMIDQLNAVMDAVKVHCENTNSPGILPVGSACCAKFPDDDNWYRARVRSVNGNRVTVAYVDYGNEQDVNVNDLRMITQDLIQLPSQALKCALKGFEDKPVETKTSNQLEMLALEKTLMAHVVGVLNGDTMLVNLVDDSVSPPLDIARKMNQLSQPRSHEPKVTTPIRRDAPEQPFSSPESVDDKKGFRREKSFKDDRRPPREGNEDFGHRGSSFRRDSRDNFDRSGPGRHSEKFGGRPDKGERKPWEKSPPVNAVDDEWEESPPQANNQNAPQQRNNRSFRDNENKFNKPEEWEDKNSRPERRDNRPDRRENNWGDKKDFQKRDFRDNDNRDKPFQRREYEDKPFQRREFQDRGERKDGFQKGEFRDRGDKPARSNFTPRDRADRADRSFGSDKSFKSQDSRNRGQAPPYKSRGKFTQVQYKELTSPVSLETPFNEPIVEPNSQHEISVTWIVSPDSFYTQILSHQSKFVEMMHKIPEMYKGVKPYSGPLQVGGSVLARYPEDGVLYRATIVSVQPFGKFIVQYVDFGNKFLVDARDVWQLENELMELPKMAVHCSLVGVAPKDGEWKANKDIDLCFNAPRYQCVYQECVEGKYNVSLWNNGASVADTLVEKDLAAPADLGTDVTLKDEAIDLTIIVGQQIVCKVTHVVSMDEFYVQLDLDKAAFVENAIANFDVSLLTPLTADSLAEGVHCTVKHDDKIYRAILNDVSDASNIKVVLPDYGKTISTTTDKLMILPTELSVVYYQSLACRLNNYTEESKALLTLDELKERVTDKKMIIYINDTDGIKLVTTLYDITTGAKLPIFEPDEGAFETVTPLCERAVFNYNFGMAFIAHMISLNQIYLQKSTDTDKIAKLLDSLYYFYEEGTPEALETFELQSLCVAKSKDGNWYRATITSTDETTCTVHYTDYGNSESIEKDKIKKLDPQFHEPCGLALEVSLGLVSVQENAVDKLKEWTEEKEVQVTLTFGTNGWLANLHLDGVDLSIKLVNEKLATPQVDEPQEAKPLEEEPTKEEEPISLPEGCTQVFISHIDSPGQFWLQMSDKIDRIEEIQAELREKASSYPALETPEMNMLCVAKYSVDSEWYRAQILDTDSDITTVRFIDYGNTDVLDNQPGLLKVLPDNLKDEGLAVKSSVNAVPTGTGQWSEPASDCFTQLVDDTSVPVNALIVLKDVTTYVDIFVNGLNLTDKLVSEGHATKSEENDCGDLPSCFASHVNSPSEFWIQLETAAPELQAMETAMVDAENFPELTCKEEGVLCAAKYPEDGAWYRAQVIVDGSEGTEVLFMDYGNASIATELRSLPDDLKTKPALSRKCALQKPRDIKSWSRKSEVKFNELAAEGATIFNIQFIASGDISIVDLYLEGKSVTEELVGLCEEHPPTERPTPVGLELQSGGKVCFVNSLDEFYVHLENSAEDLAKVMERLIDAPEFGSIAELKKGSICAAFWEDDEQWYRAKILEFCDVGCNVHFLDYGNTAKCTEFRELPEDLASIEPLAKSCRLAGVPSDAANNAARKNFEEITAESTTFQIEFLDSTKEPALVRMVLHGEDVANMITSVNNDEVKTEQASEVEQSETIEKSVDDALEENVVEEPATAEETPKEVSQTEAPKEVSQTEAPKEVSQTEAPNEVSQTEAPKDVPQTEAPEIKEKEEESAEFEDATDELNSSQNDLDESLESNHTVIENKSFEANPNDISMEEVKQDEPNKTITPEKDSSNASVDSADTTKSPEKDNSKESLADTGYTSGGDKSPIDEDKLSSEVSETKKDVSAQEKSDAPVEAVEPKVAS